MHILFHSETKITIFYLLSFAFICFHLLYHSLSFVAILCHSLYHLLSLVVIRWHSLSFVVARCTSRCRSLYHSSFVDTCCYSLSFVVPFVVPLVVTWCTTRHRLTSHMKITKIKELFFLTILTGKNCFTQFSRRIYWNTKLAAFDLFDIFAQSIKYYTFHFTF